jgi:hypothetical protein
MPTKHTRRARKPLAERVTWKNDGRIIYWASVGGFTLMVGRWGPGEWQVECGAFAVKHLFKATSSKAAKAEALRIVQRAVLEAAEAWKD